MGKVGFSPYVMSMGWVWQKDRPRRYVYAVNEEMVGFLNTQQVTGDRLPEIVRLQHSMLPVDDLGRTAWERRSQKLGVFIAQDGWLWTTNSPGSLEHARLLAWMKAPAP